jgi:zeta-carotene desaturase
MSAAHVIVIGGGLAGLAASVALADEGQRVTLLERHPRLGGRATSYQLPTGDHIDNCQHVTLRCCTNLENFYRRVGVDRDIRYYDRLFFIDSKAKRGEIYRSWLPAPLHVAPAFAAYPLLKWSDKWAIGRAMFRILRHGGNPPLQGKPSMLQWLQANHQTEGAIARFWRVVLVSALNEELGHIDAAYGIAVFWKAFISTSGGFGVGIPHVPLAELYNRAAEQIQSRGEVRLRCGVSQIDGDSSEIRKLRLDDGTDLKGDYYVAAVPFDRILKMLPPDIRRLRTFAQVENLKSSPITSIHLWLDRPVMQDPFLASVDQTMQWIFNKSALGADPGTDSGGGGQYLQVVISASRNLSDLSQSEVVEVCRKELGDVLPEFRQARLLRSVVVRENSATFSVEPGSDGWRPDAITEISNLFLAGDWTRTGWPATMESAVRSGYQAAEAVLRREGKSVQLIQSELRPAGLSAWFARHRNTT